MEQETSKSGENNNCLAPKEGFSLDEKNFPGINQDTIFSIEYLLDKALIASRQPKRDYLAAQIQQTIKKQGFPYSFRNQEEKIEDLVDGIDFSNMGSFKVESMKELLQYLILFKTEINTLIDQNNNNEEKGEKSISKNEEIFSMQAYIDKIKNAIKLSDEEKGKFEGLHSTEKKQREGGIEDKKKKRDEILKSDTITLNEANTKLGEIGIKGFLLEKESDDDQGKEWKNFLKENMTLGNYRKFNSKFYKTKKRGISIDRDYFLQAREEGKETIAVKSRGVMKNFNLSQVDINNGNFLEELIETIMHPYNPTANIRCCEVFNNKKRWDLFINHSDIMFQLINSPRILEILGNPKITNEQILKAVDFFGIDEVIAVIGDKGKLPNITLGKTEMFLGQFFSGRMTRE